MIKKLLISFSLFTLIFVAGSKRANAPKRNIRVDSVPLYNQYPELPTGCEATSLAMLLSWGLERPVSKFGVADALSKGPKVHKTDKGWRGAHPNKAFVGDPYTDSEDGSYGVFEKPILDTLETFSPETGVNLTGRPFHTILDTVRSGMPVLVWTTLEQRASYYGLSWSDNEGDVIDWYENEHAVVLVGIEDDAVVAHDPHTGQAERYNRELFERNWRAMGCRAVTLELNKNLKAKALGGQ
ncbi:Uncharacterized protein YvpB [Lentibacillus persicus]|uniref:Uncharacterized protein YvpB n=1 Tax=Lentibacillus persicus TaxID=640948 RepID=A0A1I1XU11_9BACI|nr:C39 family peptidase [Lentibacillus persicus]SFE10816.1 Uncharacterized protein YvpB [Lentibacillus persicus]